MRRFKEITIAKKKRRKRRRKIIDSAWHDDALTSSSLRFPIIIIPNNDPNDLNDFARNWQKRPLSFMFRVAWAMMNNNNEQKLLILKSMQFFDFQKILHRFNNRIQYFFSFYAHTLCQRKKIMKTFMFCYQETQNACSCPKWLVTGSLFAQLYLFYLKWMSDWVLIILFIKLDSFFFDNNT